MGFRSRRDHPEPLSRLIKFEAGDGVELSGLLFEPRRRTKRAAIYLHGTGGASIFDSRRANLLAPVLNERGIAWFPFNNRGSYLVRRLSGPRQGMLGGMAHERIRDCVHDIDGAIGLMRRRGFTELFLVGHSTGANKIAVYDFYKKRNPVKRYVLLGGGDDVGLMHEQLGPRRFRSALAKSRERRGSSDLVPRSISELPMSWRSLHDMINPDGDYNVFPFLEAMGRVKLSRRPLFRHVKRIRKPAIAIFGEYDEYCFGDVAGCVATLADAVADQPNFETVVMSGADHGFSGRERELGELMAAWLT
ncbi:MAG TPA: alpha/beta hydrolase [Thermoanaerobaculia bacterium]|nr:alpha/beta hydrolase [Thermoanaerobaculia bacterium]